MDFPASKESPSTRRHSEEQDLLERSTKKTKTSTETPMGEVSTNREGDDLVGKDKGGSTGTLSFKQIVANEISMDSKKQEELDLISDDEEDADDEVDGGCPIIRLTKEEKLRLRNKWRQTLIVKVLGRNVGYAYLLRRLTAIWHPKARMDVVTIENGYLQ